MSSMLNHRHHHLPLLATILLASSLHAQETCSEEVKLLLSPAQLQVAIPALHTTGKTQGQIYFYDTPALDLLSKGVILRLRVGAEIDLTTKLRPPTGEKFADPSSGRERYKCEIDMNGGAENPSFSLQTTPPAAVAPETGDQLYLLLSEGQRQLLADSKVQIDWKRVKRVADIQSTSWTARANQPLGKLSLELWQWPGGTILELSTKTTPDAGKFTYAALQNLAQKKNLTLNTIQRSKTAIALEAIAAPHRQ
jgi:hypothetical protein